MAIRKIRLAILALALSSAALGAACIESDTRATMTVSPDGSVRWTVMKRDIRSDGATAEERQREEREYMAKVERADHGEALAFRLLGATDVRTRIVSDEWPFAHVTEGRFGDLGQAWARWLELQRLNGESSCRREGNRVTWTAVFEEPNGDSEDGDKDTEAGRSLFDLFGDDGPVIFLQGAQFVAARGFTLDDDGRLARPQELDRHDWSKEPKLTLSLTWTVGR